MWKKVKGVKYLFKINHTNKFFSVFGSEMQESDNFSGIAFNWKTKNTGE